jgi:DNA-binding transcriptional LysR family regulator
MDIPNLKTFETVATLGSISQAAEKLHLTQPAVTRRIQILESQLNCRLFDRIGRGLFLTESGNCLLPNAQRILQLVETSRQELDDLSGPVRGTLTLVTSHHIGLHRLPGVLQQFRQDYPMVKLCMQFHNSYESQRVILAGEAEVGITTEETLAPEQLSSTLIWNDTLHFVVANTHPLLGRKRLTLEHLSEYPALLPDAKFTTGLIVRKLFEEKGIPLQVDDDLSTEYLETLKALVTIGDAWRVLTHTMTTDQSVSVLKPTGITMKRKLVCITHRDRSLSRAGKAFLALLDKYRLSRPEP